MTIQGGNIHSILRTYNKQIKYGKLSEIDKGESSKSGKLDKVTLSPEAKKVMFVSSLVTESVENKKFTSDDVEEYLNDKDIDFSKLSDEDIEKLKTDFLDYI